MGTAVSDIGATKSPMRGNTMKSVRTSAAREVEVEVRPVAFADARLQLVSSDEVFPAERSELACRIVNVTIALVAFVVMLPVMLLIALAIRLTSRGPVFYSQERIGVDRRFGQMQAYDRRGIDHGGLPFKMYKFRTMRVDAEADGKAVWAQKHDPRITSFGRLLRKSRLDELPQLWNVIRGDMNIVGPRPERPTIFAQLREEIPRYAQRQRVKPGITGWAQINQEYDSCLADVQSKVKLDLQYVQRQSLAHDVAIMSMTLPVMLLRKGQ